MIVCPLLGFVIVQLVTFAVIAPLNSNTFDRLASNVGVAVNAWELVGVKARLVIPPVPSVIAPVNVGLAAVAYRLVQPFVAVFALMLASMANAMRR
jgi:hypothetical protein